MKPRPTDQFLSQGSWFHYLCKNVTLYRRANAHVWIGDPRQGVPQLRQADATWIRAGFFLRWIAEPDRPPQVTLICFEASSSLKQRFGRLQSMAACNDALNDPYSLFAVILDELSLQLDNTVWNLSEVFRGIELVRQGPCVH